MKVLFVYSSVNKKMYSMTYHFGLGHISSFLKKHGHETAMIEVDIFNKKEIIRKVKAERPDIIGFTAVSSQIYYVDRISKLIKEEMDVLTVCGGIHMTLVPECIKDLSFDAIVRGEGEYPMLDLVKALEKGKDYTKIKGFWFKSNGKIIRNPTRPLINDLDNLPFPDREIFDYQKILDRDRRAKFMFSRGCPFQCTYCSNHAIAKMYPTGNYLRLRSPENCIEEIRDVVSKYKNIDRLMFGSDSFNANKKWMTDLLNLYKKEFDLPFFCNIRPGPTLDRQVFKKLKDAGCWRVFMGIESGNEYIRNEVMKRNITDKQMIDAFRWAKETGIKTLANNIIGLPFETEEMLKDTIKMNAKVDPNIIGVGIFYPYEGTELGRICKEKGWVRDEPTLKEREDSMLNHPYLSRKKLKWYMKNFHYLVYKNQNPKKALYYKAVGNKYIWKTAEIAKGSLSLKARRRIKKIIGNVDY